MSNDEGIFQINGMFADPKMFSAKKEIEFKTRTEDGVHIKCTNSKLKNITHINQIIITVLTINTNLAR